MSDVNPNSLTLTEEEIFEITGYRRPSAQLRALEEMGIPARRRPDNTVMVLRVYVTTRPDADAVPPIPEPKLRVIRKQK
nr:DUF4224 domain-containing protein [Herbaspirillum sp. ASV7]